jgi:hypothetical protein
VLGDEVLQSEAVVETEAVENLNENPYINQNKE